MYFIPPSWCIHLIVVTRFLGEYQGGSDKARRITKIKKENLGYKVGNVECKNLFPKTELRAIELLPLETKQSGDKLQLHSNLRVGGVFLGEISCSRR